jgi:hypothetical protein
MWQSDKLQTLTNQSPKEKTLNTKSIYLLLFFTLASILAACGARVPAPTPIPTEIPTSTPVPAPTSSQDPAVILQGFWDAIDAKNVDAAMSFVADDIVTRGGPAFFTSKAKFSAFMLSEQEKGNTFEISELKIVSEDTVTYTMKVSHNGVMFIGSSGLKFQVKDSMIVLMEFPA